ncbi:MAG: acriflavin resistance protein [Verrucomicrobia bacterium]|nr:MAG: acriflavin resistance protein [Verrucomicrobiota bacterium]
MSQLKGGIIAWFARNPVAANLLMAVIMAAGLFTAVTIKKEVFPEFSIDQVVVSVPYRGGSPQEVEEGVVVRIEEAIQAVDGIKKIRSRAIEGFGIVTVEMRAGYDMQKLVNDIKVRVDGISTFPVETERPIIEELTTQQEVLWINLYGDVDEVTLKRLADKVRDEITALPDITQAEVYGTRNFEISIEVSESKLREYGLSFNDVARAVRNSSLDLPAGSIRTVGGEISLRTKGQAYTGDEFESLVLRTRPDGVRILLGDVARVVDGFEDTNRLTRFNTKRSASIRILRVGEQSALDVAKAAKAYVAEANQKLPEGVTLQVWSDGSKFLKDRLSMLLRNCVTGLILVFLSLTLFLRLKLAIWVCLGIPLSFLGALWLMPMPFMDISINMITLFGFLVVIGIVVDDAIVVGENVYTVSQKEGFGIESAIKGAQEVAVPVTFGVLTTIVAFIPMLMVPGVNGKIWSGIGLVVIATLVFSLVESKLILPSHLAGMKRREQDRSKLGRFDRFQRFFGDGLQKWIHRIYKPSLAWALKNRYATLATFIGVLIVSIGLIVSGWVRFVFFPNIESDYINANVQMTEGTPASFTYETALRMERAIYEVKEEGEAAGEALISNVLLLLRSDTEIQFWVELSPSEDRSTRASDIAKRWREKVGPVPGTNSVTYTGTIANSGSPIDVQLTSQNPEDLQAAASELKIALRRYSGVYDIRDTSNLGKQEIKLAIKPAAEILGLTLFDLARQVRQGFYGDEAQRIQRGRDDVRVMVRYPKEERDSLGNLESMRIRTPAGTEVPFSAVAEAEMGRGYSTIQRVDRKRIVSVLADIDKDSIAPDVVRSDLNDRIIPEILRKYPEVAYTQEGEAREQAEALNSLATGGLLAAFLIFALMAIPLKSYLQPVIIMSVIPFGLIGAVLGHIIMGHPISILSMCGMIALAGVVVNDSLVMVDYINRSISRGAQLVDAVREAGIARFRPILLTSLTTFMGLSPLLLEKSLQAQILIPMAISLAFGVVFATTITLLLIPCLYLMLYDLKSMWSSKTAQEIALANREVAVGTGNR